MCSDKFNDLEALPGSASDTESDSTETHVEQQATSSRSAKPRKHKCPPREQMFQDNWL